jgi:isopentenyl diphosphate isomerase/L-lactate dehydrogenase-like FMN-dependent dehydrogenase
MAASGVARMSSKLWRWEPRPYIGRPYLYGLSVAGAEGVARVVQILRQEFELAMMLSGRPTIAAIDRSVLWQFR